MSFLCVRKIPSPEEIKKLIPLENNLKEIKSERDAEVKEILAGKSNKFIVIIGPCSADDENSVCEYVNRLAKVNEEVKDKLFIIPRIYTNKPRTTGNGYKGMFHQPNPEKSPNIFDGLISIRKMFIRSIKESHLTSADEMLYPSNHMYYDDLLTYTTVGARSVENQQHRLTASGVDIPVGMKNPTSGDISVMFNSIQAAHSKHNFLYRYNEVNTTGNPYAHVIMRGSVNQHGKNIPNYHYEDLMRVAEAYNKYDFPYPAVIVDANHANSMKIFSEQPRIVQEVLNTRKYNCDIKNLVKGVMVESYIEEGCQKIDDHIYGKSITDSCLGWEATEKLLYYIAEQV
ncbi:3-deoxy-7-phosphoheptulonate synthase [Clostridium beijerinckii]|jgi:3-deoxy-D-arabinoheptulosonate-7-phosphate synthase (EC 2.5.1.54)|uniref:Phospho-2-dehydro-3-deoxyheptonate aldolase n=2 Tax=Clostridium beijerinckii TaxID=1520 RepID=A0AAE2UWJ4_CLOBE|nr:3-deoxy-7-phosphoheptulonate synthase [Clostridium beijerinckii]ABR32878.1 phospho-2-dehydro-3-deoxyheptonate aldolase [Clostridium beijerinckii NCIMB 8052]AIU00517.1 phospho-2-dehydro-3-deoxyheptonate aldolase [Clostridium beijerinckii ATCC 35702]MBF7807445.1 3-deoxy-7-phosphoheptulonate synthase [Clostridium beijerinckii]NOW88076.1 3-deoxy-7-phosphoheptulonate synthase [Clostridium beijerinckii]NRT25882.1 3-deoxy-7-phosphoheptulonate synthase [Clostridium beijerinckii]